MRTARVQDALAGLEHPRAELALLRVLANVSRVVHLLRSAGPELDPRALEDFDRKQRLVLFTLLCSDVLHELTTLPLFLKLAPWALWTAK